MLLRDAAWVLLSTLPPIPGYTASRNSKRSFQSELFGETLYLVGSAIHFSGHGLSSSLSPLIKLRALQKNRSESLDVLLIGGTLSIIKTLAGL